MGIVYTLPSVSVTLRLKDLRMGDRQHNQGLKRNRVAMLRCCPIPGHRLGNVRLDAQPSFSQMQLRRQAALCRRMTALGGCNQVLHPLPDGLCIGCLGVRITQCPKRMPVRVRIPRRLLRLPGTLTLSGFQFTFILVVRYLTRYRVLYQNSRCDSTTVISLGLSVMIFSCHGSIFLSWRLKARRGQVFILGR